MASSLRLDGKVALVTGASRGIGAAIAAAFAAQGARLVLTSHTGDTAAAVEAFARDYGTECLVHTGDVADAASVQTLYKQVFDRFGRLDILAANAGVLGDGLIGMLRDQDIRRTIDTNLVGVINHLQAAARFMRRQKAGSIIVTSSIIGRMGNKGQTVYAATKAGLIGLVLSAAKELGPDGIRVNAVAPGIIETDMTKHLGEAVRRERLAAISLGHFGAPEDVADTVFFLASGLARYVTGQVIGVDGGMVI